MKLPKKLKAQLEKLIRQPFPTAAEYAIEKRFREPQSYSYSIEGITPIDTGHLRDRFITPEDARRYWDQYAQHPDNDPAADSPKQS